MSGFSHERRRLLRSSAAWIGGIAAIASGRSAAAFESFEASPKSSVGLLFGSRCSVNNDHAALVQELQVRLAGDPNLASPLTATCPFCGCPVTVSR